MTEVLAHAPTRRISLPPEAVEQISQQAREVRPGVAAQALIGGIIYGVVFLLTRGVTKLFRSLTWCVVAGRMGYREARGLPVSQPSVESLLAENDQLRKALARLDTGG